MYPNYHAIPRYSSFLFITSSAHNVPFASDYPLLEELPTLTVVALFDDITDEYAGFELQCNFKPMKEEGNSNVCSHSFDNNIRL